MTFHPPYSLSGQAGQAMDATWRTLADLGIHDATLDLRSLDVDTLQYTQRAKAGRVIAADGQWVSLKDSLGTVLLSGLAKRKFIYPSGLYQVSVNNVYRGMLETPLTDTTTARPYVSFDMADLATTLRALLARANTLGLPIQPPTTLPAMFAVPKMAFRAASCGSAFEEALKWLPDAASRMDYSTTPPTLRLSCRASATPVQINLDTPGHGVTAMDLTAMPEARALFVAFVYAVRDGALLVNYLTQSAGDASADAHRALSIYLSGHDRSEMLVSEALVTSSNALLTAQASLAAANAAINAVNTQISATYWATVNAIPNPPDSFDLLTYVKAHDPSIAAHATLPWRMSPNPIQLYPSCRWDGVLDQYITLVSYAYTGLHYSAPGWPVPTGTFTDAQLVTAGATKASGSISGQVVFETGVNAPQYGYPVLANGYPDKAYTSSTAATAAQKIYCVATVSPIAVDLLSKAPSVIRSTLYAQAAAALTYQTGGAANTSFIDRAEFVEAPADLALNYFTRQNWTPFQGQLSLAPSAPVMPAPGDFVGIFAADLPPEFATMATPVSALSIDLATGASTVTLGPSPRMTYSSLQDRLRIPPEDNYKAG